VGFAPDAPSFPDALTFLEAITLFAALKGISGRDASAAVTPFRHLLQLDEILDKRVGGLSRGNLLKLGLLQAMIHAPGLLVSDEPFGALDPVAQVGLRTLLRAAAARGAAVLVSSHQLDQVAKVADRVLILDRVGLTADHGAAELAAGWLVELEISDLTPEAEARLRRPWAFSAKSGSLLTVPSMSAAPTTDELRRLLPEGSSIPRVVRSTPLSLEAIILSTLANH
jgi:ABC-2 type transport system ATP-binding protein